MNGLVGGLGPALNPALDTSTVWLEAWGQMGA